MKKFLLLLILVIGWASVAFVQQSNERILAHTVDLKTQNLKLYWQNDQGEQLLDFDGLKNYLKEKGEELVFATNGGMYLEGYAPQGLYIENGKTIKTLDTLQKGYGNFYMKPNGVFCVIEGQNDLDFHAGMVCTTEDFQELSKAGNIQYATQSGPMLLIDGQMHPKFRKGSENLNIRNGVGVLPNGELLFAMSKEKINFYDFASYFKQTGCQNALYLDGYVSRTYLPEQGYTKSDHKFGVMIGETVKKY